MRLVPIWGLQFSFVAAHLVRLHRHLVATPSRVFGRSLTLRGCEGQIFGHNQELGDAQHVTRRYQRKSGSFDALGWVHHQVRDHRDLLIQTRNFPLYLAQLKGGGDRSNLLQDIYLEVSGLRCGSCVKRLEHALSSKQGVIEVRTR